MKIRVRGYLTFRNSIGERLFDEDQSESFTLRDLLSTLSKEGFGGAFEDLIFEPETSRTRPHIAILINGNHYTHLPDGLDTQLKDGDEVSIFPPIAGG
jgi:molybdopterin synthase sulfur carrier subunit